MKRRTSAFLESVAELQLFTFQQDPRQKIRSALASGPLSFNLTEQWKFSASGNYDLNEKEIVAPSIQISRDLHCWLMSFTWVPLGPFRYYRLEIRVKAPQLQEHQSDKTGSARECIIRMA